MGGGAVYNGRETVLENKFGCFQFYTINTKMLMKLHKKYLVFTDEKKYVRNTNFVPFPKKIIR